MRKLPLAVQKGQEAIFEAAARTLLFHLFNINTTSEFGILLLT
jgi:hypothetical protein